MISEACPTKTGNESDVEASAAIEELIAEYGLSAMVRAVLKSTLADSLNRVGSGDAAWRAIQVLLRQIVYAPSPQLEAEIMSLGAGLILCDEAGCRHYARKHGLTPAAISKRVIAYCEANNLPPSQYMRSLKDRETYRLTNRPRTK